KIKDKKCWNLLCTAKYNGYNRLFLHSYSEACKMNGPSTMCLKNAYISPETDTSKKETYYLIDIQNPLFVPPTKYVYETNFTSLVNTSFNKALNLLRLTKPDKHKCKSTAGCWDYARRTEKYEERNILLEYTYNGNNVKYRQFGPGYKPLIHAFAPEYNLRKFDTSYKDAFINGVKTYSRCYALKDCA